jgi:hypothetical protein
MSLDTIRSAEMIQVPSVFMIPAIFVCVNLIVVEQNALAMIRFATTVIRAFQVENVCAEISRLKMILVACVRIVRVANCVS